MATEVRYPLPEQKQFVEEADKIDRYGAVNPPEQKGKLTPINATFGTDEAGKLFKLPPPAPVGTNGSGNTDIVPTANGVSAYDKAAEKYFAKDGLEVTDADRQSIRDQARKEVQDRIDAVNVLYNEMVGAENVRGEGRVGSGRAISSRRGVLGSDFGDMREEGIKDYNKGKVDEINAKRGAELSSILTGVTQRADAMIKAKEDAANKKAEEHLSFLLGQQEDARKDAATLAKSGLKLDKLASDDYKKLLDQTGYDQLTFDALWNSNQQIQMQYQVIEDEDGVKKILGYGTGPDGQLVTKTYDSGITGGKKPEIFNGVPYVREKDPTTGEMVYRPVKGVTDPYVGQLIEKYSDAGILPTDSLLQAQAKLGKSAIYRKDTRVSGSGSDTTVKDSVAEIQAQLDNYALDKAAGRDIPAWAEAYITPERKRNSDTGDLEETGEYTAKKVTKGQIEDIRNTEESAGLEEEAAQLRDVDFVASQILEDRKKGVSIADIRQAAVGAGVSDDVLRAAMNKALNQFYNEEAIGAR